MDEALHLFAPLSALSDWELFWYSQAVQMKKLPELEEQAREEKKKRRPQEEMAAVEGVLPDITSQLAGVRS